MIIGVLTVELAIFDAQSLKDKRSVVKSLKQRIRNRFNVSVSEVGRLDEKRRCRLGVCMVSNESRATHSQLDLIVELIRKASGVSLVDYQRELL